MERNTKATLDWSALRTSVGSAKRVPALVRALVGDKGDADRRAAYVALRDGLRGCGVVSTSAAPTVPLLCDVLASGKEGAHRAGWLIAEALTAGHERVLANAHATIGGASAAVRAAVREHGAALVPALADPDPRVRAGTAFALAWADPLAGDALAALRAQVAAETNDIAAFSELLAIGLLASTTGVRTPVDRIGAEGPWSRTGAALARILGEFRVQPADAEAIVDLLRTPLEPGGAPWCEGAIDRVVVAVASRAGVVAEMAVEIASKVTDVGPAAPWQRVAGALLALGGFTEARWDFNDVALEEELTDVQRAVAMGLARRNGIVVGYGMPRSARDRRRWLGIDPPGPLEKRVKLDDDHWPIWKVWRTQRSSTERRLPPAVAERLDPDETLVALAEVSTNAYSILMSLGGAPLPADILIEAARKATSKSASWARAYADEILALVEAKSGPELGGELGMLANRAVFPAILEHGGTIEPRWFPFLPLHRAVLEKMPPLQREAAVWERLKQPHPPQDDTAIAIVPLLDLVPSERICDALVARIAKAGPRDAAALLARIAALRST
jgi:hypothetical protein